MLSRRGFLRGLFQTVAAATALAVVPPVFRKPEPPKPKVEPIDEETKARLIREFLKTEEGRARLAAAMTLPIRSRLDYQAVGRAAFQVDPLPQGALPIYDRSVR